MKNADLRWYEAENPNKLYDVIDQYLYDKGMDSVDEMLSDLRNDNETSAQHVERRHMQMDIDKMVRTALKTGQTQGTFMNADKNILPKEEVYDMFMTALYDKLEDIAIDMVNSTGPYSKKYTADMGEPIGYCINDKFELVKTTCLTFAINENTNPFLMGYNSISGKKEFIASPLCCSTIYPEAEPEEVEVAVVKTREELMKEYHLTKRDLEKFDRLSKSRSDLRDIHQKDRDTMQKDFEKNALSKMMQSR